MAIADRAKRGTAIVSSKTRALISDARSNAIETYKSKEARIEAVASLVEAIAQAIMFKLGQRGLAVIRIKDQYSIPIDWSVFLLAIGARAVIGQRNPMLRRVLVALARAALNAAVARSIYSAQTPASNEKKG